MRAPAPIDRGLLEPVLAPLGRARTLPAVAYTSPVVLAWEAERFFAGSWVCVGRAADLRQPGDQAAVAAGSESVLLVRDGDGVLRGFFNVCRHRGHELLACGATTNRRAIVCPYHAWVYRLDGPLRSTPRLTSLAADDPAHEGLVPARVAEWHGWVLVNLSGDASGLARHVGELDAHVAPYQPERLVPAATHQYEVAANWKLVVENYHECYHCPSIHPELCRVTPSDSGRDFEPVGLWAGGSMDLKPHAETMSLTGLSGRPPLPGLPPERRRQVLYLGLFPNFLLSLHPDYVMTHRVRPLTPGRSLIECQWLFDPDVAGRPGFDPTDAVGFWDVTNRQDWRACEGVQRGVASRGYRQGPLALHEGTVHQFLGMVTEGYLSGGPPSAARPANPRNDPETVSGEARGG